MDCYSDHSAILDYLAQVEQEDQLRESLKSKSGIAALRVEKGSGPYRKWEKQPLCDELGEASSSSHEDDYIDKGHCDGPIISKKTMQYLIWFNAALFILVVLGGTLMGTFGNTGRAGHPSQEPPGSFIRHNALVGLHSHPVTHAAPAPAPASLNRPVSAPYIAPAPAASFGAPGLAPAAGQAEASRDYSMAAGGVKQRQFDPAASSAALAAAQYWKEQQAESMQEVGGEWEDGNLTPTRPASATAEEAGEWEDGNLTPAKPTLAAAQGAARYWGRKAWASAPAPLPHVPAPAPGPARAARPGVGKMMASWAHQAAAQATQGLPSSLGYSTVPAVDQQQPSQHMQGSADPSQYPQAQAQPQPQPQHQTQAQDLFKGLNQAGTQVQSAWPAVQPAGGSGQPSQPGAGASGLQDLPSQAAMAGEIYNHATRSSQQGAQDSETPVNRPAAYSKWAPFHAQPKSQSAGARPAQAGGATYLTPSEIQAIGASKRRPDTTDMQEEDFLNDQRQQLP